MHLWFLTSFQRIWKVKANAFKNFICILFEKFIKNEKVIKQAEWFFWFFWYSKSFPFNSEANSPVSYKLQINWLSLRDCPTETSLIITVDLVSWVAKSKYIILYVFKCFLIKTGAVDSVILHEKTSSIATTLRSSRPEVFCKEGVLRNFTKFTGKHLCQSLFFTKVAGLKHGTLLKNRLWDRCFLRILLNF